MCDFSKSFLAGTFGGMCGIAISHPFDTLRIRIQTENFKLSNLKNFSELYRGVIPPLLGVSLEKTIVFGSYNYANQLLKKDYPVMCHGISGLFAGFACTAIVTPVERVKINLQSSKSKYNNSREFIVDSIRKNGVINTFYRGWTSTLTREIPGYGIYFSTYEYLKKNMFNNNPNSLQTFLMGGFCGGFSWLFIYPSDVIKSRMQLANSEVVYKGVIDCINKSVKSEGIRVFYKGFYTSLLRAVPLHAGVFTGYELFIKIL